MSLRASHQLANYNYHTHLQRQHTQQPVMSQQTQFQSQTSPVVSNYAAHRCRLTTPRHQRRSTLGHWAFTAAGRTVWNSLPDQLKDPDCIESMFHRSLKTILPQVLVCFSILEMYRIMHYKNPHFTHLFTYLYNMSQQRRAVRVNQLHRQLNSLQ